MNDTIKSTSAWFIISATVVIVFGGALTWANVTAPNDTVDTSIIAPVKKETDATTSSSVTTRTTTTDELASWKAYTNSAYGFSLTFTDGWKGYQIKEVNTEGMVKTLYINVPTTDPFYATESDNHYAGYAAPFAIGIMEKSKWTGTQEQSMDFGSKVGEKGNYVFTYSQWQACPTDLCDNAFTSTIKTVIDTFVVL